jgi:hypothetical protein
MRIQLAAVVIASLANLINPCDVAAQGRGGGRGGGGEGRLRRRRRSVGAH